MLRAVAVTLLDGIIESGDSSDPVVADAMCLKGELLLPYVYYGKNVAHVPRSVLQEAYTLFERAASPLGTFLKGRWLLSMEPLHKDASEAEIGRQCVKNAAEEGCARALVFLAHRYEYPELDRGVSFAGDVPKGKVARENFILGLYLKAAELGDPDALNDVGTSYAEGYGQVVCDFDRAVDYYVRAINMGSLHAFDNLGTHYETGMGGRCPDRVDFEKALFYYRMGVESRCPKCAYNLGAAHEEGMQAVLQKDLVLAERFYNLSILLADDCNDLQTAVKSLKDLTALLVTRIKMGNPDDAEVERMKGELVGLNKGEERAGRLWARIHKAIGQAVKGRTAGLTELLGDENARMIVDRVKKEKDRDLANYLLGPEGVAVVEGGAKKKKERPKRAAKKRRK